MERGAVTKRAISALLQAIDPRDAGHRFAMFLDRISSVDPARRNRSVDKSPHPKGPMECSDLSELWISTDVVFTLGFGPAFDLRHSNVDLPCPAFRNE